ncbi:uncharacterized protein [Temnothorax nylanderi]|uniref:uncharacterized protein n=1 Tax=Temnothorax nylanderi TaxID=102681 RepID=UPI003A860FF7
MIEIRLPSDEAVLFVSVYRRPKGSLLNEFVESLTGVSHIYKNIIIGGDLNCNLLTDCYEANYLRELMSGLSLTIVNSDATFHTATSDSWLDVLVVDDSDKVLAYAKSLSPFIAGHDLLELSYSLDRKLDLDQSILRRGYRSIDASAFLEHLDAIAVNVQTLAGFPSNVDELCAWLSGTLLEALDVFAPARASVIRKPPVRWLTDELRSRLRTRNQLYKQARRSSSLLGYARYRHFRNQLNNDIKRAKSEFHLASLANITDSAKMWRELARLGLVKSTSVSPLRFFTPDQLNSYYVSVSGTLLPCTYADFISAITSVSCTSQRPEFVFSTIQLDSVYKLIFNGPLHSYASGYDGIPLYVLRIAWPVISQWLIPLFNRSLEASIFPSSWKRALIRPLSKIRTPLSPSDTRPIANLPEMSKILERMVASQITDYLNEHNLLNPRQSAYRSGFNTQSALLRVCDDIRMGIDKRLITIMILFDFSKAFDTVPHLRLLIKLKEIGFSDEVLAWIFSYLTGRSQAVFDNEGNFSEWLFTSTGVPQGSVLGPLLFALYINDIGGFLSFVYHMIFADDVQIYLQCTRADILHGLELISRDANAIFDYATLNGLKLNPAKSKVKDKAGISFNYAAH